MDKCEIALRNYNSGGKSWSNNEDYGAPQAPKQPAHRDAPKVDKKTSKDGQTIHQKVPGKNKQNKGWARSCTRDGLKPQQKYRATPPTNRILFRSEHGRGPLL